MKDRCTVVLLAAGQGLRMGGDTRKQYLNLEGRPLFTYSLETMDNCEFITDIVIMVPGRSLPAGANAIFPFITAFRRSTGPVTMCSSTTQRVPSSTRRR